MAPEPFRFELDPVAVDDLRDRLRRTRWPDALDGAGWELGTDADYLRELCAYWAEEYDFDAFAARLNAHPQVVTEIEGQRVHAYDVPAATASPSSADGSAAAGAAAAAGADAGRPEALPLLLVHGWPGSTAEMLDVLGPLTDPAAHGIDARPRRVVVPSLPGYGSSGPTTERGMDPVRIGALLDDLMTRLGIDRFVVHGGDWGSRVVTAMAERSPERVAGLHLTMLPWWPPSREERGTLDAEAQETLERMQAFARTGVGYQAIQSTKPQTLAYGLTDSPAGLAGWIVEKLASWTDGGEHPEATLDRDRILDDVTVYWLTGTINGSMRLYLEQRTSKQRRPGPVQVPIGFARFPGEPFAAPRGWAESTLPVVRWTAMERGGHFPAMEAPWDLAAELLAFADQVDAG